MIAFVHSADDAALGAVVGAAMVVSLNAGIEMKTGDEPLTIEQAA